ncbi:UNVERIFIED_ORG: hypothetical protein M2438_001344 [Methylobacterium sp. SuP10 SLI 274]|uniref:hypothetical protein n=1 Tax=Methylorubrum extorquens TaxID=408 RepID=UPI00209C7ADC|nr:hypothetical protein [Methylorubrum extorquens]MDF9862555.1 hypothetical protein [Methylorubrum pseudosasae]MDH6636169.1 hypothetical protein [Methylobacterium sp. SuP10 SLI 274]MDH6665342.1 hypothetical protein [Methylorubrum zatmanii]MCP1557269.1 hypothetical protein [Methylorubrum extorquens]MDF9790850.1 hypothetical protein [Methylorubrum extorquens]
MNASVDESFKRQSIVMDFLTGAISGDEARFSAALAALKWAGAFREAFEKLVSVGAVHPRIRPVFRECWRRMKAESYARLDTGAQAPPPDWHLERDLCDRPHLLADGLKLLMPTSEPRQWPFALYRGQRLADHQAGSHGVWWAPCPVYAEMFARMPSRLGSEAGAVVVAFDPHAAIIGEIDGEYLVDPRLLEDVQLVAALPLHRNHKVDDLKHAFAMTGIPDGFDGDGLIEWLDLGMPVGGLPAIRARRVEFIEKVTLVRVPRQDEAPSMSRCRGNVMRN